MYGEDGRDRLYGNEGNDYLNGGNGGDILYGGAGNDTLFGEAESDLLVGDEGNDKLDGGADRDNLQGGTGDDLLFGGTADDWLYGQDGNDILTGVGSDNGVNTIDNLTGGSGNARFVLGSSTVFYNDGNNATLGSFDYALIKDFNSSQDKIQLTGSASQYVLGAASGVSGTGIYLDTNNNDVFNKTDELIGVVQGSNNLNLTSSYFLYI